MPSSRAYPTQPHPFHRTSLPPPVPQSTYPHSSHQPSVPPPIPKSTHPQSSSPPHAPAPTPTRHPAPIYENVSRLPPPQPLSRSSSHDPSFPVPLRPERHPHNDSSGPPSPMMQRSTTIPIPSIPSTVPYYDSSPTRDVYQPPHEVQRSTSISIPGNPNTAPPIPYYDSSPPSSAYPPSESHSEMSGGAQPIERSWSYRTCTTLVYSTTFAQILYNDRQSTCMNERISQVTKKNLKARRVRVALVTCGREDHQAAPSLLGGNHVHVSVWHYHGRRF